MQVCAPLETSEPGIADAGGLSTSVSFVDISALKPTQIAVGYREVCVKFRKLDDAATQKRLIRVVAGPRGQFYLRDGHHLALALHLAGSKSVRVTVVADLSDLGIDDFWRELEGRNQVHPFDGDGRRQPYGRMPSNILCVDDDIYRSLAGALRRCGGYAKSAAPYADFAWADFLRHRIDVPLPMRDFSAALVRARQLAASRPTEHLPGWLAPNARAEVAPISAHAA
jgi:hypothetical protein